MGDLVLFQDEVNPVLSELLDAGLEVTALHNHFFFDEPKVYFMHIGGEARSTRLAKGVRRALDKVKEIRAEGARARRRASARRALPATSTITGQDRRGHPRRRRGRRRTACSRSSSAGRRRPPAGARSRKEMGVNTWAAFAGTDDNAVVDGDFAMLEDELQGVLKALRKADINIVAIHHHMTGETPALPVPALLGPRARGRAGPGREVRARHAEGMSAPSEH